MTALEAALILMSNTQERINKGYDVRHALMMFNPRRVDYEGDGYADGEMVYDFAKCPECENEFEDGDITWGCSYCPNCGQALKWGD